MRALVIPADDTVKIKETFLRDSVRGALEDVQELVGGMITTLAYTERLEVVPLINAEGHMLGLQRNNRASAFLKPLLLVRDYVVGDVVLVGSTPEGKTVDLPEEVDAFYVLRGGCPVRRFYPYTPQPYAPGVYEDLLGED